MSPYRYTETEINFEEEAKKERIKKIDDVVYDKLAAEQDNFVAEENKYGIDPIKPGIPSSYVINGRNTWDVLSEVRGEDNDVAQRLRESYYNSYEVDIDISEGINDQEKIKFLQREQHAILKVLESIDGLDDTDTWFYRNRLSKRYEGIKAVLSTIPNNLRDYKLPINVNPTVLQSIGGCDSDSAWDFRRKCLRESQLGLKSHDYYPTKFEANRYEQINNIPTSLIVSLKGLDSEEAWKIREQFIVKDEKRSNVSDHDFREVKERSIYLMLTSINGLDSDKAWQERNDYLQYANRLEGSARRALLNSILDSMTGINSDDAWEFREMLQDDFQSRTLPSRRYFRNIQGIDSKKANAIRKQYEKEERNTHFEILDNIMGIDSKEAWRYRNKYAKDHPEYVLLSLQGLGTKKAMDMRRKLLNKDLVMACARSLQGVENTDETLNLKEKLLEEGDFNTSELKVIKALIALTSNKKNEKQTKSRNS